MRWYEERLSLLSRKLTLPLSPQCNQELDMQTQEFNDIVERFMYTHQQSQLRLREALTHAKTRASEVESRRNWDEEARHVALNTRFPQSIEAYDEITNRSHKLRVSRLLVAPTTEEKGQIAATLPGLGLEWTEAECMALMSVFGSDVCARLLHNTHTKLLNIGHHSLHSQRRCGNTSRSHKARTPGDDLLPSPQGRDIQGVQ